MRLGGRGVGDADSKGGEELSRSRLEVVLVGKTESSSSVVALASDAATEVVDVEEGELDGDEERVVE